MLTLPKSLGSITTLVDVIESLENDTDHTYFYRGHSNKKYQLIPSIYRNNTWIYNENRIVREMLSRCPSQFYTLESKFECLVKMQHYDLPTRLLDITENPLVALYFACFGNELDDGQLLIFKIPKNRIKFFDSDAVTVVSNLAWVDPNFEVGNNYFNIDVSTFNSSSNPFATMLLESIQKEHPNFERRINPADVNGVLCVKPKMNNERIIRQDGAFLLFGCGAHKKEPANFPDNWLLTAEKSRLIISKSNKTKLLDQLHGLGVYKAKLFPEIDTVAQFIKQHMLSERSDFKSTIEGYEPATSFAINW